MVEELASEPRVLCHRDYHSRNLMVHGGQLYVIDFQDARMGPDTYDLASLLRDSYVDITERRDRRASSRTSSRSRASRDGVEFRPALRPDGAAAESQGARHVRLSDHRARQSRLHPVHSAHAAYVATNLEKHPRFARLREILATHVEELR